MIAGQTVLVAGATGNIGISAILAALRSKAKVLALVRNDDAAKKLFSHIGQTNQVTTINADVTSENGVADVVEKVKNGKLPAFQHVVTSVGQWIPTTPVWEIDSKTFKHGMNINLESNFYAYKATMPYLLSQTNPTTFTMITGGAGDSGIAGVTAISQGALFSLANTACAETSSTNVRFNEIYLNMRVDLDSVYEKADNSQKGPYNTNSSTFSKVYEQIWARDDIKVSRISVLSAPEDITNLKVQKKLRK